MKNKKRIVFVIFVLLMLTVTVFAEETKTITFKAHYDGENISVTEDELISEVDNSDLEVNVVKQSGDSKTTIFTGKLVDYDNGAWVNTDFSEIQFMVIYNWENPDDGAIYIIPTTSNDNMVSAMNEKRLVSSNTIDNSLQSYNETGLTDNPYKYSIRDMEIKNSNGENVNSLKTGVMITAVSIAKLTEQLAPATIYAAIYDNGKLKNIKTINTNEEQENGTQINYTLNFNLNEITPKSTVKIMIWNGTLLQPYSLSLDSFFDYRIKTDTVINQLYTIPVTAKSLATKYKIGYDNEYFTIVDLCKETEYNDTQVGVVSNNIRIDEITDSSFTFSFISANYTECVNRIVLKARKSGTTYLSVEEMTE